MGVFDDEFDGVGGTYIVGKDGKRTRVPEGDEQAAQPATVQTPAPITETKEAPASEQPLTEK